MKADGVQSGEITADGAALQAGLVPEGSCYRL